MTPEGFSGQTFRQRLNSLQIPHVPVCSPIGLSINLSGSSPVAMLRATFVRDRSRHGPRPLWAAGGGV